MAKGWAKPARSKEFHYFNNDRVSLCRGWMYAPAAGEADDSMHDHPDNCAKCKARVVAALAKKEDDDIGK